MAAAAPVHGGQVGPAARAMTVSDYLREPVDRLFGRFVMWGWLRVWSAVVRSSPGS